MDLVRRAAFALENSCQSVVLTAKLTLISANWIVPKFHYKIMDLVRNPVFALSNTIQFVELMVKLTLIDVNWIVPM